MCACSIVMICLILMQSDCSLKILKITHLLIIFIRLDAILMTETIILVLFINPQKRIKARDFQKRGESQTSTLLESAISFKYGGIDENLGAHGADDYDFPWCMAEAGYKFRAIDECLYYYRDHRNHIRLTTHVPLDKQIFELKKIFNKHEMTDELINRQIYLRSQGYLKQALFLNDHDKKKKQRKEYDITTAWREKYHN